MKELNDFILSNPYIIQIVLVLALWDAVWKLIALWKAARNNQKFWFILVGVMNTIGILPIIYILALQKKKE